jgi:hypothetical protein
MLLRLRQACDHPLLVKGLDSNSLGGSSIEMAKKLPQEKQLCLLKCLEASLAICGICSVCRFFSCPITLLISTFAFSLSCNFTGLFPYVNFIGTFISWMLIMKIILSAHAFIVTCSS